METTTVSQMAYNSSTDMNDTTDWKYWEDTYISVPKRKFECSFAYVLYTNKSRLILHPWSDIESVESLCWAKQSLANVVLVLVIATGIPGNLLSLLTIMTLPKSTGAFYVALLSGSDLITIIIRTIDTAFNHLEAHNVASCKTIRMFENYTGTYANWVLVLICFERFISIKFPLKKSYYFPLKRARLSALLLAALLLPFGLVYLWIMAERGEKCYINDDIISESAWALIEGTMYSYLPAILLVIMVVAIALELKKLQKARKSIFSSSDRSSDTPSNIMTQKRLREEARVERSLTMMLFFAAITLIVLTLPVCVVRWLFLIEDQTSRSYAQLILAYQVALSLTFMSHAINFFIYFISTSRFRTQLFVLLKCPSNNRGRENADPTAQTQEDCL